MYEVSAYVLLLCTIAVAWKFLHPRPGFNESMKKRYLSDAIKLVQEAKGRQEKLDILNTNMCSALIGILRMNFDKTLQLDVDLNVLYRPRKKYDSCESLNRASKRWSQFTTESKMPTFKKNIRLRAMLEKLEPGEAELFLIAARRELKLGISAQALQRSFPKVLNFNC